MTRNQAREILNAARDGADIREDAINAALRATGDLDDDGPGAVRLVMRRRVGSWERGAGNLLAPAGPFDALQVPA